MNKLKKIKIIVNRLNYIFTKEQKRRWFVTLCCILSGSVVELLGVSAIFPLLQAMVQPDALMNNRMIQFICSKTGLDIATNMLTVMCVFIIIIYVSKNAWLYFTSYRVSKFSYECQRDLSTSMLTLYMKQPYVFFLENNSASMLRGINDDVAGTYTIVKGFFSFISFTITAVLLIGYLIKTDVVLALGLVTLAGLCVLFLAVAFKTKLREYGRRRSLANKRCNQTSIQALSGIKEIMVFHRHNYFVNEFREAATDRKNAYVKQTLISNLPSNLVETVCLSGFIALLLFRHSLNGDMVEFIPELGIFAMGALKLLPLVAGISSTFADIVFYYPSLENVYLNFKSNEENKETAILKTNKKDANVTIDDFNQNSFCLTIENISWKYPTSESYVLDKLSLEIKKGHAIALIGGSGAGKSTLADVILGLLPPQEGSVRINGIDISSIPEIWSKWVSYVPQSVYLIDDSIRNNIAFGINKKEIDDKKVWKALEKAQLSDFVKTLPDGLDTIVGERGVRFSGGQRQRVSIARALYNEPEILILDEATSALDNETEQAVMESINALHGEITMIVIAHRLTTISCCDFVYEVKGGVAVARDKREILECAKQ